jgi:hypothetical protein
LVLALASRPVSYIIIGVHILFKGQQSFVGFLSASGSSAEFWNFFLFHVRSRVISKAHHTDSLLHNFLEINSPNPVKARGRGRGFNMASTVSGTWVVGSCGGLFGVREARFP